MKHLKHEYIVEFEGYTTDKRNFFSTVTEEKWQKKIEEMSNKNGEDYGYLMMELCEYGDLENFIINNYAENEYMDIEMLKIVTGQVIELIAHMHRHRLCHRDLKPGNILVKSVKPYIELKLCDFGLSRASDRIMRSFSGTRCTQDYDILLGKPYNDNTELFSLGCIVYYILYKKYPAHGIMDKKEIAKWYLDWGMTLYSDLNGTNYSEFVHFFTLVFDVITRDITWNTLMKQPLMKECVANYKWAKMHKVLGKKK